MRIHQMPAERGKCGSAAGTGESPVVLAHLTGIRTREAPQIADRCGSASQPTGMKGACSQCVGLQAVRRGRRCDERKRDARAARHTAPRARARQRPAPNTYSVVVFSALLSAVVLRGALKRCRACDGPPRHRATASPRRNRAQHAHYFLQSARVCRTLLHQSRQQNDRAVM
jgi:hypothetical protein